MRLFSEYPGFKRVPNFVGLDFDAARALQLASGWGARDPDPDAPPITNHWWSNKELVVASQTPAAGSLLKRDERVSTTLEEPREQSGASVASYMPPNRESHAQTDSASLIS